MMRKDFNLTTDTGVYCIINWQSHKIYVGSTARNFSTRWRIHRYKLRHGLHVNQHLQRSWNKYGEAAFEFMVLEVLSGPSEIIQQEQYWLDFFRLTVPVYNAGAVARHGMLGRKHSPETRARISMAKKGKPGHPISDAAKRKISQAHTGKTLSKEHRQKLSAARQGKPLNKLALPYPAFQHRETGEIIPAGLNLSHLCRERQLRQGNMYAVIHGQRKSCKGWLLACNYGKKEYMSRGGWIHSEETKHRISNAHAKPYPAFRHCDTGEIIPAGHNLVQLCQRQGLSQRHMWNVMHGKRHSHGGWALAKEEQ